LQQYDQALADYNKAIELGLGDALVYNNRGHIHAELQQDDQALAITARPSSSDPANATSYANVGRLFRQSGKTA
jgi:tetratricopeptide (TPR) repeat protein